MKFNKLRVVGFKSFVEPAEFIIERGLTGVVGPNGCGKSNLVEALRWVMGESSYKNMRASGMDDVIFSGSGHRPARNVAEVALYLDNSDRTAPAAFNDSDEIQVSRRIEREQGSVYRINGKEARAKDVQLLFADASTGARSPSMVGQGRIGELIQAKPQARRQLLEEAAGISGLHSRRHEAELRLRGAETNLERLEDIIAQLETQIESLKRQARQANRFKMLSAELRAREALLLHIRWTQAKTAEGEAESALNQATVTVAEKAQIQMEAAKNQALAGLKMPQMRDEEAQAAAALQRLQVARTQLEDEASRLLRRRDELTRHLAQLGEDIRREERLIADNAEILARLDAEDAEMNALVADAGAHHDDLRLRFEEAATLLAESEAALSALTAQRAEALAQHQQSERSLQDFAMRRARLEKQTSDSEHEYSQIDTALAALPDPDEKRILVEDCQHDLAQAETILAGAEADLTTARSQEGKLRVSVEQARSQLRSLETEARTIRHMLAASVSDSSFSPVADTLVVDRGYETALGAVLGDDIEAPEHDAAPAYWVLNDHDAENDPALPEGVVSLAAHMRGSDVIMRRLRQIGIVTGDQALALMPKLKPGQRLVTKEGAVYRWDGYVIGADAPSAAALRLAQKNRLGELNQETQTAQAALSIAEQHLEDAVRAIKAAEHQLETRRDAVRLVMRQLGDAREDLAKSERAAGDLVRRRDVIAEAITQLQIQLEYLAIQEDDLRIAWDDMADPAALEAALAAQQTQVSIERSALGEARARFESLKREGEERQRRLRAIEQERQLWKTRAASAEHHIATLREREDDAREEMLELDVAPDEFDQKRIALMNALDKAERARREAADRLAQADLTQREADQKAALALSALAESREKRGRTEERLLSVREKRHESEQRIRETLGSAPHEALRLAGLASDTAELPDPQQIEREVERLKIERERLGAVNLRAEEEHKELGEKRDILVRERDDVVDAIRKLRSAIQSLNREGRDRLIAAFDVVNAQFQRLFTHLFNGGTAELQLIESDDPLEAGLEILARPPGKKPQTMTLLSGGEQALTAMALIFAVFLTNPAPICVLDEVDAPLDDHNVERYCNLMDEMAASTQTRFVIITHNPITMARMNRLFGVTMAEQGVSQLVSVDLQTAEQLREIA